MRRRAAVWCVVVVLAASGVEAGFNKSQLVPAYQPCASEQSSCPAVLESRFTFESAALKSAKRRYLEDGKIVLVIELKGVRDETGALVSGDAVNEADDFVLVVPGTQITVLGSTYAPGVLGVETRVRIEMRGGTGRASYTPPPGGETSGVVAEALQAPYVLDSDGKRLAVPGSRAKPTP